MFRAIIFLTLLSTQSAFSKPSVITVSRNSMCEGYEQVKNFKTLNPSKCLGLVLDKNDVPWIKPRRILFKDENTILVSDLGGWISRTKGSVWEVDLITKDYKKIYEGGDWTHGLAIDNKGRVLIGDTGKIIRIERDGTLKTVVKGLPTKGSHPLSHFILLPNQDIVLNIGAPSNDCSKSMANAFRNNYCKERDEYGEVVLYQYVDSIDSYKPIGRRLARGLRNSMALVHNESMNSIYQAENNLDQPGVFEEFNEIPMNRFEKSKDFGWPFCHSFGEQYLFPKVESRIVVKPNTFRTFCSKTAEKPLFLIPPHSSPLDMMYYEGEAHSELQGQILMSWHGHRRDVELSLVSYETDENSHPIYEKGVESFKGLIEGVSINSAKDKLRPVGMALDSSGLIFIIDDVNNSILVYGNSKGGLEGEEEKEKTYEKRVEEFIGGLSIESKIIFDDVYSDFYQTGACTDCHGASELPKEPSNALKTLFLRGWLDLDQEVLDMVMMKRMSKDALKPMPPSKPFESTNPEVYSKLKDWLEEEL